MPNTRTPTRTLTQFGVITRGGHRPMPGQPTPENRTVVAAVNRAVAARLAVDAHRERFGLPRTVSVLVARMDDLGPLS